MPIKDILDTIKQVLIFLVKIPSFWKLYQNYGYDGETVEFIIDTYEKVLDNRTKTMSKPTYYLEDVLREIDDWYEKNKGINVYASYDYHTRKINFSVEFRDIESKEELISAVISKMTEKIESENFPE